MWLLRLQIFEMSGKAGPTLRRQKRRLSIARGGGSGKRIYVRWQAIGLGGESDEVLRVATTVGIRPRIMLEILRSL
jgi:hypothetical protein